MIEWMRFGLIVTIAVIDHLVHELIVSFNTTWDFLRHRGRWIVQEKMRAVLARRRR